MHKERIFENRAPAAAPAHESSEGLTNASARAHGAPAAPIVLRWMAGSSRAALARWHRQRQTRGALMRCSDRVLADIGIEREHIRLVAKGIDPAEYQLREPTLRRWWAAARDRMDAARAVRTERRRLYRELDAYSDRELDEIGLRRADIPVIARGKPVFRRAA